MYDVEKVEGASPLGRTREGWTPRWGGSWILGGGVLLLLIALEREMTTGELTEEDGFDGEGASNVQKTGSSDAAAIPSFFHSPRWLSTANMALEAERPSGQENGTGRNRKRRSS